MNFATQPLVSGSSWWAGERGDPEMVHLGLVVAGSEAPAAVVAQRPAL
jgi:hypothetical protein